MIQSQIQQSQSQSARKHRKTVTVPITLSQFPILSPFSDDYASTNSYKVKEIREESDQFLKTLEHQVSGENLVRDLLQSGCAAFGCTVSAAHCSFRSTQLAAGGTSTFKDSASQKQNVLTETIEYDPPIIFQPIVVSTQHVEQLLLQQHHGVNDIWQGTEVSIPKGATIAVANHYSGQRTLDSILSIQQDNAERLPDGSFDVEPVAEKGFYFSVKVAPDLFQQLRDSTRSTKHKNSIYCMALSQGLERIARDLNSFDSENFQDYPNLKRLYSELKNKNAKTWEDDDFNANIAVALLVKHELERNIESEE